MRKWWIDASNNQRVGLIAVAGLIALYVTGNLLSAVVFFVRESFG